MRPILFSLCRIAIVGFFFGSIGFYYWYFDYRQSVELRLAGVCTAVEPYLQIGSERWAKDIAEMSLRISNPELKVSAFFDLAVNSRINEKLFLNKYTCSVQGRVGNTFSIFVYKGNTFGSLIRRKLLSYLLVAIFFIGTLRMIFRLLSQSLSRSVSTTIQVGLGVLPDQEVGTSKFLLSLMQRFSITSDSKKAIDSLRETLNREISRVSDLQLALAKRRIFAKYIHDIRSPVGALKIIVNRYKNSFSDAERELLVNAIARLTEIPDIILRSEKTSSAMERAMSFGDTKELLRIVADRLNLIFENRCKLFISEQKSTEFSENLSVLVSAQDLDRLTSNLCINSQGAGADQVSIAFAIKEGMFSLTVVDNGKGGLRKDLSTVRKLGVGGPGLGLEIVKDILFRVNGEFQVDSVEGKVTKIEVKIPLAEANREYVST